VLKLTDLAATSALLTAEQYTDLVK
jgi:hypothetical protein